MSPACTGKARARRARTGQLALVGLSALALALGACGKKGPPEPPEGSTYPRVYPQPSTMVLEGDLLAPTRTIQDNRDIRSDTGVYPSEKDFPDRGGFDEDKAEREPVGDLGTDDGGIK